MQRSTIGEKIEQSDAFQAGFLDAFTNNKDRRLQFEQGLNYILGAEVFKSIVNMCLSATDDELNEFPSQIAEGKFNVKIEFFVPPITYEFNPRDETLIQLIKEFINVAKTIDSKFRTIAKQGDEDLKTRNPLVSIAANLISLLPVPFNLPTREVYNRSQIAKFHHAFVAYHKSKEMVDVNTATIMKMINKPYKENSGFFPLIKMIVARFTELFSPIIDPKELVRAHITHQTQPPSRESVNSEPKELSTSKVASYLSISPSFMKVDTPETATKISSIELSKKVKNEKDSGGNRMGSPLDKRLRRNSV